jgi:hypothetical protein
MSLQAVRNTTKYLFNSVDRKLYQLHVSALRWPSSGWRSLVMYNCGYDLSGDEISCTFTLLCIIGYILGVRGRVGLICSFPVGVVFASSVTSYMWLCCLRCTFLALLVSKCGCCARCFRCVVGLIVSVHLLSLCGVLFCHCTCLHCCISVLFFSSLLLALCSGGNRDPGCVCGVTFAMVMPLATLE